MIDNLRYMIAFHAAKLQIFYSISQKINEHLSNYFNKSEVVKATMDSLWSFHMGDSL